MAGKKKVVKTDWKTNTIGDDMKWIDTRKPGDGFEPDWEVYVEATTIRLIRRLYRLNTGKDYPKGVLLPPETYSIINGEIKKLVNELTESWY